MDPIEEEIVHEGKHHQVLHGIEVGWKRYIQVSQEILKEGIAEICNCRPHCQL